jgi:hypothetical protein
MQQMGVRERDFGRALLTHDYSTWRYAAVYPQQVLFMAQNPATPFFTLFQYIRGSVKVKVQPFSQLRVLWPNYIDGEGGLHNDLIRATHSGGRMDLHVLGIPLGLIERYFVVPLRSGTSYVHDKLAMIAKRPGVCTMPLEQLAQMIWVEIGIEDKLLGSH